ncbi:hypothetical protein F5B22DRAFT_642296 [Xylaria bambusicola]|uniref:uncharacterized protein n=1 Tax=Xylaria bambusicola TaxID=326684 RepID=UPI002008D25F|nr:uncharacterized protein F5B22DRAFT_642296 [Xylaria bambusicola]KAI0526138.1 hypothetical protein F5B22DRAFT_642296 [Xylaria bambusicola]
MGVQFFTNWELWEQLTFVLAAGIVVVFIIGWIKLWWMQRLLKKHTLLDEEKRARQTEMRKSGLPVGRRVDIPFGVRAIQSGVEVEGIWISRPATPIDTRSSSKASSTTLDIDSEVRPQDKGKAVNRPTATVSEVEPTPRPSPRISPTGSHFDPSIRQGRAPSPPPHAAYIKPYTSQRPINENTHVARLLRATAQPDAVVARHHVETYMPTSSSSSINSSQSPRVKPAMDRVSFSSEEGLAFSSPRHPADVRSKPSSYHRSPFDDAESPPSAASSRAQSKYCSRVRAETRGDPFESPETDRTSSSHPRSASRPSLASTRPTPIRTYTEQRENRSTRIVNAGFEILPAGTFGRPSGDDNSPGLAK